MDRQELNNRYGKHLNGIMRIGAFPLTQELQLSDLGNDNEMLALVQRSYKEIKIDNDGKPKKEKLKITIIDYLCMLTTMYLADMTRGHRDLLLLYEKHKEEVKCFLRYFIKNPLFYLGKDDYERFNEIMTFWFIVVNSEVKGDKYWENEVVKKFMEKITPA